VRDLAAAVQRRPNWRLAVIAPRATASPLHLTPILQTQNGGIPVELLLSRGAR
jgi:hypothetical protein